MNATYFVKKYGLEYAKHIAYEDSVILVDLDYNDLKRLVESHELVQVELPELKKSMFSNSKDLEYVKNWLLAVSDELLTEKGIKLKRAITDVESCL